MAVPLKVGVGYLLSELLAHALGIVAYLPHAGAREGPLGGVRQIRESPCKYAGPCIMLSVPSVDKDTQGFRSQTARHNRVVLI